MLYVPSPVLDWKSASVLPPPWTECSRAASRSCLEPIPISCVLQKPEGVIAGGKGLAAEVLWDKGKFASLGESQKSMSLEERRPCPWLDVNSTGKWQDL